MNYKHPLFYTGIVLLIFEIVCMILMPSASGTETLNESSTKDGYIIYMFWALTGSFISAFLLLAAGIIFILKGSVKKNAPAILALLLSFLIPMLVYYSIFN